MAKYFPQKQKVLFQKRVQFAARRIGWASDDRLKILISCNRYYTPARWRAAVARHLSDQAGRIQLRPIRDPYAFYALLPEADVCLCYGISQYIELKHSDLKLIYFGIAGQEALRGIRFPASVAVRDAGGIARRAVAEHALMTALILSNNFHQCIENKVHRKWQQERLLASRFRAIREMKIGVLGVGKNGQEVAKVFHANGCEVYGCDSNPCFDNPDVARWFAVGELNEFLEMCDIAVICLPLTPETRNLIDLDKLRRLGPHSFLINTARGEIINEKELLLALRRNMIKGAAIDTFENEPLPRRHPLWRLPNVILSPHVYGNVNKFIDEIQSDFLKHVKRLLQKSNQEQCSKSLVS